MAAIGIISTAGFQAVQNAQKTATQAADKIAKSDTLDSQTEAIVELKQAELQLQAAVKIIDTEKQTIGYLLDIKL